MKARRSKALTLPEAAELALKNFVWLFYQDEEEDGVAVLEAVEDLLVGIRAWSRREGDAWDDAEFVDIARRLPARGVA